MMMPKVFPPVYLLLAALLMWLLARFLPLYSMDIPALKSMAWVFFGAGLLIDGWSLFLFFRAKTTFHPLKLQDTTALVTTGMYRWTRNPMYLGMAALLTGWFLYLQAVSPVLVIPLFIWWLTRVQIRPEEKMLQEKFGQAYTDYCADVRRWI